MPLHCDIDQQQLTALCTRWGIRELAVFGSALRPDFGPDSDLDVLVTFEPARLPSLFGLSELAGELEALVGRPVDVLTRPAVEQSRNAARRAEILQSAEVLYAA